MPRKHMDSSTRVNLERNLGISGRHEERLGGERAGMPIVDEGLEREVDQAGMAHLRGPHAGKGPKNYTKSDESIREDVCQALYVSSEVDASKIDVDVKDKIVYLRGVVEDRRMKKVAEIIVEHVRGVWDVQNELTFII